MKCWEISYFSKSQHEGVRWRMPQRFPGEPTAKNSRELDEENDSNCYGSNWHTYLLSPWKQMDTLKTSSPVEE